MVESEDDLRHISLTADLAKDLENFIADWLEPYILSKLDPGHLVVAESTLLFII